MMLAFVILGFKMAGEASQKLQTQVIITVENGKKNILKLVKNSSQRYQRISSALHGHNWCVEQKNDKFKPFKEDDGDL